MKDFGITVGELRSQLEAFDDDCVLALNGLTFSRVKLRGDNLLQIETQEIIYRDKSGNLIIDERKS